MSWLYKINFSDTTSSEITKIEGIKLEADVVELKTNSVLGQYTRKKLPGRMKSGTITLTRPVDGNTLFSKWFEGIVSTGLNSKWQKSGTLQLIGPNQQAAAVFSFTNAWPSSWSAGQLDPNNPDAHVEQIELALNGLERTS